MTPTNKFFWKLLKGLSGLLAVVATLIVFGVLTIFAGYVYYSQQLPNVDSLKTIQYQVPLRIYTRDGKLIAEYGEKRRDPVALAQIPPLLVNAFIATEDQRFWDHPGVDPKGLFRAAFMLATTGKKVQGGSTITMQVARNYFLDNKKTFSRKFKEILLALKINRELSKDKIIELYLNKIYLGNRAYGVGAAAQVYYGKTLDQLTLPQMAMLAGLPKAPSNLNPLIDPVAAKDRRNHVLERMYTEGYITQAQYDAAVLVPVTDAHYHGTKLEVNAPYVAEMARNAMVALYGDGAYTDNFAVYTTINSKNQMAANNAVRQGVLDYDQRHGYRGTTLNLGEPSLAVLPTWEKRLKKIPASNGLLPAAVTGISPQTVNALLANGEEIVIPWSGLSWAKPNVPNRKYPGATPKTASDIVKLGDVIRVTQTAQGWRLSQLPQVQGALISLNPNNGAIEALVGGFDFYRSNFNRVTQAQRQAGSGFKPYIYTAALAKGDTLATVINDAPVVMEDPSLSTLWRPQNDEHQFYGPTRLRWALTKSRNLVSIRLLRNIGIPYAVEYISRFGFDTASLPHSLSLALGTAEITPLQQARGYAIFANGGYRITPYFIERIANSSHQTVFQAQPQVACEPCLLGNPPPSDIAAHLAPNVIDAQDAYLMTSAMMDVIQQGTGTGAKILDRNDLSGKTGTTQNENDGWFSGFNADIVTVAWMGYDQPRTLYEFAATTALPIWVDYMGPILAGTPEHTMPQPPGITSIRIDKNTGMPTSASDPNGMFELFREGALPQVVDAPPGAEPDTQGEDNSGSSASTDQLF